MNLQIRILERLIIWIKIFIYFKPLTISSAINLIVSCINDISRVIKGIYSNPITFSSGLYYIRFRDLLVYTRKDSDDIYNLLPTREKPVEIMLRRLLKPGDIFVDVGANVGYYSLLAAKNKSFVIAIEPAVSTFLVLKQNIRMNNFDGRILTVNKCSWKEEGIIELKIPKGLYGLASIISENMKFKFVNYDVVKVECIKLDDILSNYDRIKIVKIDAEGAEYEILLGMMETMKKIDVIILELSRNISEVIRILKENNYKLKKLNFYTYIVAYRSND